MSTYWHFECTDHTPPLLSEEFTQHTDDIHYVRGIELAQNRPVAESGPTFRGLSHDYFDRNARAFLFQHPACSLAVVSEYGTRLRLPEPEPTS